MRPLIALECKPKMSVIHAACKCRWCNHNRDEEAARPAAATLALPAAPRPVTPPPKLAPVRAPRSPAEKAELVRIAAARDRAALLGPEPDYTSRLPRWMPWESPAAALPTVGVFAACPSPSGSGCPVDAAHVVFAHGPRVAGLLEGHCRVQWCSGALYEGDMKAGQFYGFGTLSAPGVGVYTGQWKRGRRHGFGSFWCLEVGTYIGAWVADYPNGEGMFHVADNARTAHVGFWCYGLRHGPGKQRDRFGAGHRGAWLSDVVHGRGERARADGLRVEGCWRRGQLHGFATQRHPRGAAHTGWWKRDVRDGNGTLVSACGWKVRGRWNDGALESAEINHPQWGAYAGQMRGTQRQGFGDMRYACGARYEGDWRNDLWDGSGRLAKSGDELGKFPTYFKHGMHKMIVNVCLIESTQVVEAKIGARSGSEDLARIMAATDSPPLGPRHGEDRVRVGVDAMRRAIELLRRGIVAPLEAGRHAMYEGCSMLFLNSSKASDELWEQMTLRSLWDRLRSSEEGDDHSDKSRPSAERVKQKRQWDHSEPPAPPAPTVKPPQTLLGALHNRGIRPEQMSRAEAALGSRPQQGLVRGDDGALELVRMFFVRNYGDDSATVMAWFAEIFAEGPEEVEERRAQKKAARLDAEAKEAEENEKLSVADFLYKQYKKACERDKAMAQRALLVYGDFHPLRHYTVDRLAKLLRPTTFPHLRYDTYQ